MTRGHDEYLSEIASSSTRVPTGHPEGFIEGFANIYCGFAEAVRSYIDGKPLKTEDYVFPTVYDGRRGIRFIQRAVDSVTNGSTWVKM